MRRCDENWIYLIVDENMSLVIQSRVLALTHEIVVVVVVAAAAAAVPTAKEDECDRHSDPETTHDVVPPRMSYSPVLRRRQDTRGGK
jgi:hypothetical protein